jgi:small subunit ribosomal protein S4|uniref:ribosomal protein S4 n=1 Tax=Eustigmatophyceae sp. WTwin 8/9 T-6m6.8 TaxID=2974615 RepID=UPI0021821EA3|nr:ribosomal protein S4 [Eustigmatophyceae sp. WTwin 8/9 T-6m6.8]UVI61021.1 ribosomal protein S4 [Eustigmatophyceae sp. WTwin 8/9 T-6m6.8]
MSRYRGPRLRLQRRLGVQLSHLTRKRVKNKKRQNTLPGQHGYSRKKVRRSEFRMRLEEKQKLKFNYSITETQLFRYVKEARRIKGSTGLIILQLLEMRLDTIVYRLNFTPTILSARQLVSHGHVKVNDQVVTIPSFQCQPGDIIQLSETKAIRSIVDENTSSKRRKFLPYHLSGSVKHLRGGVKKIVDRRDIKLPVNELLVVEYYSRR